MSHFDRLDKLTSRAVDRAFSVPFALIPQQASPNGRPCYDPTRPCFEARGIVSETPSDSNVEIGKRDRSGNSLRTLVGGQAIELSVDYRRVPEAQTIRQGDRIEVSGGHYFVSEVLPDGLGRIVFRLLK